MAEWTPKELRGRCCLWSQVSLKKWALIQLINQKNVIFRLSEHSKYTCLCFIMKSLLHRNNIQWTDNGISDEVSNFTRNDKLELYRPQCAWLQDWDHFRTVHTKAVILHNTFPNSTPLILYSSVQSVLSSLHWTSATWPESWYFVRTC